MNIPSKETIPWVMTWDGIVTKTHKYYLKELGINNKFEAYMQSLVIRKTLECISLDYRRGEERDQELIQEVKVKLEREPNNKKEVNQDTPGEVENKE